MVLESSKLTINCIEIRIFSMRNLKFIPAFIGIVVSTSCSWGMMQWYRDEITDSVGVVELSAASNVRPSAASSGSDPHINDMMRQYPNGYVDFRMSRFTGTYENLDGSTVLNEHVFCTLLKIITLLTFYPLNIPEEFPENCVDFELKAGQSLWKIKELHLADYYVMPDFCEKQPGSIHLHPRLSIQGSINHANIVRLCKGFSDIYETLKEDAKRAVKRGQRIPPVFKCHVPEYNSAFMLLQSKLSSWFGDKHPICRLVRENIGTARYYYDDTPGSTDFKISAEQDIVKIIHLIYDRVMATANKIAQDQQFRDENIRNRQVKITNLLLQREDCHEISEDTEDSAALDLNALD